MVRQKKLVDQLPMDFMLPETDWTPPDSLPDWRGQHIAIDLETKDEGLAAERGAAWYRKGGFVTGVSMSNGRESIYVPVRHPDTVNHDHDAVGRWLADHLDDSNKVHKIFHNAGYDLGWANAEWGIKSPSDVDDTKVLAFCVDENRLNYSLDNVCSWQGVDGKDEWQLRAAAEAFGLNPKKEMWKLPAKYVGPYAGQDATSTFNVFNKMIVQAEAQGLMDAYRLECDLLPMTNAMRKRGIRINTSRVEQTMAYCYAEANRCLEELGRLFPVRGGRAWAIEDVRSPIFMAQVFTAEQVPYPQTAKGNDSFSNEWMSKSDHKLPQLCARATKYYDAADKFLGKYIAGFTHMGRIHAEIHSTKDDDGGTRTTRFSYSDPPLQQMPSRDEDIAIKIRSVFEPEEGEVWAACDYSQQEFRLMVHFASVCQMEGADRPVAMYNENPNTDFHDMVVEITGLPRRRAKDVNFAKAFGAGIPKFASMTGMTFEEAKQAMEEYDDRLPFVSRLGEFCSKRVDVKGYIRMIDGFRGRFERWEPRWIDYKKLKEKLAQMKAEGLPEPSLEATTIEGARARTHDPNHPWYGAKLRRAFTHKAMNTLIQGSAARQMKKAMRECYREGILPLLQMHDELDLSVSDPRTAERVGEIMRDVVKLVIPVKTDIEYGVNWGRAAKDKSTNHTPTWDAAVKDRESGEWN